MSFLDRVKRAFGSAQRTYEYWCPNCEANFESPKSNMSEVSCPECAETRIRTAKTAEQVA